MLSLRISLPSASFQFDKKPMRQAMRQAATEEVRRVKSVLRNTGGGRTYGHHTAAAPGMPPASLTGQLLRGVKARVTKNGLGFTLYDRQPYAVMQEAGSSGGGGRRGSRNRRGKPVTKRLQPAHPFISAILKQDFSKIQKRMVAAINQGIAFKATKVDE